MYDLPARKCVPCRGGVPAMAADLVLQYLTELDGWIAVNNHHLEKNYTFPNFVDALAWVNRIGALAEEQGHHPDIYLTWGKVRVQIYTHKINGLSECDFILAAKMDQLTKGVY
jgi:4a-hydroxytetrahydrobiopterin dehydratase